MMCLPCASRARARISTSNADSIPIRVIRSAIFMTTTYYLPPTTYPGPCLTDVPKLRRPPALTDGARRRGRLAGLDANQCRRVLFRQQVQIAIRPLAHVADPLLQLAQQ